MSLLDVVYVKSPYEQISKQVALPPNLSNQEVEQFFKQIFEISPYETLELSDAQGRIHFIGNSLSSGQYFLKTSSKAPSYEEANNDRMVPEEVPQYDQVGTMSPPAPSYEEATMQHTMGPFPDNNETMEREKPVANFKSVITTSAVSSDNNNSASGGFTFSAEDASIPLCCGIDCCDLQSYPCGSLEVGWFWGTMWTISLTMQSVIVILLPCICAKQSCNGNVCAVYIGRTFVVLLMSILFFPLGLVTLILSSVMGLITDLIVLILWCLSFGFCFQCCPGCIPKVRGSYSSKHSSAHTEWENVEWFELGTQCKRLKQQISQEW